MTERKDPKSDLKMEGEGSREGSRRFQDAQRQFAKTENVESIAQEAAEALDGAAAAELEKARKAAAKGKS